MKTEEKKQLITVIKFIEKQTAKAIFEDLEKLFGGMVYGRKELEENYMEICLYEEDWERLKKKWCE